MCVLEKKINQNSSLNLLLAWIFYFSLIFKKIKKI